MYVRLAFAVAAYLNPEILIIDEVLAVGDAAFQKKCLGKMEEVAETLQDAGVEPIMAAATARRQDWSARIGLKAHFPPEGPKNAAEVLAVLETLKKGALVP